MKKEYKNRLLELAPYILLFLITTAILFTVYAIKEIFPFGDKSIVYADFAQSYVPQFYHYWDVLNGYKNPFFDWYSGTGISMVSTDMLSPFNLFFLLIPRDGILNSMSFFFALKVVVSAITCYIFINRVFKNINIGYKIGFSVLYSMSGYVLQYYSNIKWLDIVAVFPILMLGFYYLMKKEKILLYAISLTVIMLENFYVSTQVLIFLLFTGGLYIVLMVSKREKGYKSFLLAVGTVFGIGLSLFKSLPTFATLMGSSRGEGNANRNYFSIINVVFKDKLSGNDMNKWFMLMGLEIAIVLCIILIARFVKHKRATLFFIGEMLVVCLPIIFEGANKLWHTGSYAGFPMRSGFTISFVFIVGACYCLNFEDKYRLRKRAYAGLKVEKRENEQLNEQSMQNSDVTENVKKRKLSGMVATLDRIRNKTAVSVILGIIGIISVCFTIPFLLNASELIKRYGCFFLNTKDYTIAFNYLKAVAFVMVGSVLILSMKKMKLKSLLIVLAVIIPLSVSAYSFIGVNMYVYPEQQPQFIYDTEKLNDSLPAEDNVLNRIKVSDNSLNTNYPFILQRGSLSNWTHTVSGESIKAMKSMGYSGAYTRMIDTGGTLLTDAVMGIKNTLTKEILPSEAYTLNTTVGEYNYYNNNYTLPTCLVADDDITKIKTVSTENVRVNNAIYHSLSDDTENIMEELSATSKLGCFYNVKNENLTLRYTIKVTGKKMLYFKTSEKNITITVNGQVQKVPTYLGEEKVTYPSEFNNNLLSLGVFENGVVSVSLSANREITESQFHLYVFDMEKLDILCEYYSYCEDNATTTSNSLSTTVTTDENGQVLFVPVCYDKGWSAKVNGKNVEISPAINEGFMAVPLEEGVNEVEMKFTPHNMVAGTIITLVFVALLMLYIYFKKESDNSQPPKVVAVVSQALLYLILIGATVVIYIVPIIYEIFIATGV